MRVSPAKSSELHFAPPSLNLFQPYETVEILEWVALLWILALAKARSAAPISAAISAKRATKANTKINATLEGASTPVFNSLLALFGQSRFPLTLLRQ